MTARKAQKKESAVDDIVLELAETAAIRRKIGKIACKTLRAQLLGFPYATIGKCKKLKSERAFVFFPQRLADMLEEHGVVDGEYYDRDTLASLLDGFLAKHCWQEDMATPRVEIELPGLGLYATPYSLDALGELATWYRHESLEYAPPFVQNDGLALYLVDGKRLLTKRELFAYDVPEDRTQPFAAQVVTRRCDGCHPVYRVVLPDDMPAVVSETERIVRKETENRQRSQK